MKRIVSALLAAAMLFSLSAVLAGCGEKKSVHILTRGEWIEEIAALWGLSECCDSTPKYSDVAASDDSFTAVQACAEWGIIDRAEEFKPNDRASVGFAIVSAVKSIGLERIEKSVDGAKLTSDEDIVSYFSKKTGAKYMSGSSLYSNTAAEILDATNALYASLELEQYQDIDFTEDVVIPKDGDVIFSADGETAAVVNGSYDVGEIIVLERSTNYPEGKYAKIVSIENNVIRYEEPTIEEMFDHVVLSGTYEPEILGVIPLTDGVEVKSIYGAEAFPQSYMHDGREEIIYTSSVAAGSGFERLADPYYLNDISLEIKIETGSEGAAAGVSGSIALKDITVTPDFEMWGPILTKAEIEISDTLSADVAVYGELSKTIELARVPCRLFGVVGVDFILEAKIGISGRVSLAFSVDTSQGLTYKPFCSPKFHADGSNPNLDVELEAKSELKPQFKAEFVIGPAAVANVGVYSGVEASAKTKAAGTGADQQCIDVNAYVPLAIFVGAEKDETLLGKLDVKHTFSIWNSSNSPVRKTWHIEDGSVVPACTRESKDDGAPEDGYPDIDIDLIENAMSDSGALVISAYFVALDEGRNDTLKVIQLPKGYTPDSITFTALDPSVVSVSGGGELSAVGQGAARIKVSTSDGEYVQYCAVTVMPSYAVDFTPLKDMQAKV